MQGKRGMSLESIVDYTNSSYIKRGVARIDKIATPTKITNKSGNAIKAGFFEKKSTVDYIGTLNTGRAICFDCKETKETKRFPLGNIARHQIEYMHDVYRLGGAAFLLIYFYRLNKFFRLGYEDLKQYWDLYTLNPNIRGYGSIPIEAFSTEVTHEQWYSLHYLKGMVNE